MVGGKIKMNTVLDNIEISGRGIHSGERVDIIIMPSDKHGIFFKRVDINEADLISSAYNNVGETKMRNTTIGNINGAHVQTIEHLMAALFMCGIDSAIIEINGPETPILDGSAAQFIDIISKKIAAAPLINCINMFSLRALRPSGLPYLTRI